MGCRWLLWDIEFIMGFRDYYENGLMRKQWWFKPFMQLLTKADIFPFVPNQNWSSAFCGNILGRLELWSKAVLTLDQG